MRDFWLLFNQLNFLSYVFFTICINNLSKYSYSAGFFCLIQLVSFGISIASFLNIIYTDKDRDTELSLNTPWTFCLWQAANHKIVGWEWGFRKRETSSNTFFQTKDELRLQLLPIKKVEKDHAGNYKSFNVLFNKDNNHNNMELE